MVKWKKADADPACGGMNPSRQSVVSARRQKFGHGVKHDEEESMALRKFRIQEINKNLNELVESDESGKAMKKRLFECLRTLEEWEESLEDDDDMPFTNAITNRMELSVMSVNGVTDRTYIANYVRNMRVKDSSALRRYIAENEPGLDYNIEIERPASLGGGSTTVFLSLDQYVFLNIA